MMSLNIAGVSINLSGPFQIRETSAFEPFILRRNEAGMERYHTDYNVTFIPCDDDTFEELLPDRSTFVYACNEYREYEGGNVRVYHHSKDPDFEYAVSIYDHLDQTLTIWFREGGYISTKENSLNTLFAHMGWEKMMIEKDMISLHAACVDSWYGGILYTGPSGSGKSTQSEIWMKYEGGNLLNGDKTIIKKEGSIWRAYGSPYAGSSKCYINDSTEIAAIVLVEQSSSCRIEKLTGRKAFTEVYKNLIIRPSDPGFVRKAVELAEGIASEVPVYRLGCTLDEEPVLTLLEVLQ